MAQLDVLFPRLSTRCHFHLFNQIPCHDYISPPNGISNILKRTNLLKTNFLTVDQIMADGIIISVCSVLHRDGF
ncbi:hypothetical protein EYF80_067725 [Liparis tanakae]|uniref:Uncharacterized protein n=1 Tax=Liparis tanakae TaxID=230148 RepID=A0A4Z2E038_9TELE|nr:hypothetical protein EYF80_067725 [Liparis tanakae]